MILTLLLCCLHSCVSPAYADELELEDTIEPGVYGEVYAIDSGMDADILEQLEIITGLLETMMEEPEPVEGEITQGQFNSYVMGCLLFFVIVILVYFACKFFAMFF